MTRKSFHDSGACLSFGSQSKTSPFSLRAANNKPLLKGHHHHVVFVEEE